MIYLLSLFSKKQKIDVSALDTIIYFRLDENIKRIISQKLKIYDPKHFSIFEAVDRMFAEKYRFVKGIEASHCGLAPILGPSNCIKVFIPKHAGKVILPRYFEGFPIIRINEHNTPTYRNMVDRIKNKTESA
ncbi:MAG TPA: hypothetical protein VHI78_06400 [Bacteroidales bacterium]|jgi:hypothetical protein|nr:hypothetical protein [Bacteroidales bacterium]